MKAAQFTVLLVDDHPLMREGLASALPSGGQLVVCGEAGTCAEARERTDALRPDLLVLDLMLGGRDGISLLGELLRLHPPVKILVYSSHDEMLYARRALRTGAMGYLMKTSDRAAVVAALLKIARGERVMSAGVQAALVAETLGHSAGTQALDILSDQELEVLRLLGAGLGLGEMAAEMNLSVKTIGTYRERLKNKLGIHSARELARKAASLYEEKTSASRL